MRWCFLLLSPFSFLRAQSIVWADDFETPVVSTALGLNGPFMFGKWSGVAPTIGGNAGVVRGDGGGILPFEGSQHFAFNGGGSPPAGSYIEQAVSLTPGIDYVLSYAVGRGGQVGQLLNIKVEIDSTVSGGQVINADLQSPPQANAYAVFDLGFTAPASGVVWVRFTDLSGSNQVSDLWLDGVSVRTLDDGQLSSIPEPGVSAAVLGLAGAMLWLTRRRGARGERQVINRH